MVELLPKLSNNLLEILDDDKEYCDIKIEVGTDPYARIFSAHMVILNYRSSYFKRILLAENNNNNTTLTQIKLIKLPNILPEIFQIILKYIYGGKLSLEGLDTSDIIKILIASNELDLQELIPSLESFLIENGTNWMEQNFNLIYQISFENNSFLELRKYCNDLISKQPNKILESLNLSLISEKLLISIIQSDNLKMKEIQVWDYVIKWGISKNPELSSDPKTYSKDNFNVLKNTLQQCIPLIKFCKLTSKEFSKKILPYRKIFPKELYMNLLNDFLNNDSRPIEKSDDFLDNDSKPIEQSEPEEIKEIHIDSKIITSQHAELISKWIDKLEITDRLTSSYEFKLLFRASRDGFSHRKFHEICDNKSRTLTIIKIEDSDEIVGGYNPIEWKSGDTWGVTKDSFIFSFKDSSVENCILSRVKNEEEAIYNGYLYPSFGKSDLRIGVSIIGKFRSILIPDGNRSVTQCVCEKNSYEKPIRETEYSSYMEETEVFQIV